MQQRLVRIDHLLQIDVVRNGMREGRGGVVVGIEPAGLLLRKVAARVDAGQDAAGEVAAHRHEVDLAVERRFEMPQVAADFEQVLVREGLVDREVRRAPAEVGRRRGFHPRAGRARDGRDVHVVLQQPRGRQRQQRQLDRRGEAPRVGDAPRLADAVALPLRKSVDESVVLVAEVLRQVNDPQPLGNLVLRKPCAALPVCRAEEDDIDLVQVVRLAEAHLRVALKPAVHLREAVAGIRRAVHEP